MAMVFSLVSAIKEWLDLRKEEQEAEKLKQEEDKQRAEEKVYLMNWAISLIFF